MVAFSVFFFFFSPGDTYYEYMRGKLIAFIYPGLFAKRTILDVSRKIIQAIHSTTMNAPGNAFIFCFNKSQTTGSRGDVFVVRTSKPVENL